MLHGEEEEEEEGVIKNPFSMPVLDGYHGGG